MSITQILKLTASWSQMQNMLIACKTSSDNMSQLSPLDLYKKLKVKRLREGALGKTHWYAMFLWPLKEKKQEDAFPSF